MGWGDASWGEMIWGGAPLGVPLLPGGALALLALLLLASGWAVLARWRPALRRAHWLLVVALVGVPMAAWAVTIPNTFVNGTVADADEVNANFTALANALNLHEPDPSAHHVKTTDAGELTSGTLAAARLPSTVSLLGPAIGAGELEFDPATQTELDAHALLPAAHHAKTVDAGDLLIGTLADARLSASVSLLGPSIATGELAFDPATQPELDAHAAVPDAHHAVIPNEVLVAAVGGDFKNVQDAIDALAPSASDPWVIRIAPGVYTETLTLKGHLRLLGTSTAGTVLEAPTTSIDHVSLDALEGVELSRLTLRRADGAPTERAIAATESELSLLDVAIEGYGVEFAALADGSVLHVERSRFVDPLFGQDRGILLLDSEAVVHTSRFQSKDCAIEAVRSALTLASSEILARQVCAYGNAATPRPVVLSHNRMGAIAIDGNVRARIVGNEVDGAYGGGGVRLDSSEPAQLIGNSIHDDGGVPLSMTGDSEVIGNRIVAGGPDDAVTNFATAAIVGNWVSSPFTAISDGGSARITGNTIASGGISASTSSVVMGNQAPTASDERWRNAAEIRIESTAAGVRLEAGGSTVLLDASGDVSIQAAGDLSLSGANVTVSATGELELNGSSQIDANGGQIHLN